MDKTKWATEDVIVKCSEQGDLLKGDYGNAIKTRVPEEIINRVVTGAALLQASYASQTDLRGDKQAGNQKLFQDRGEAVRFLMDRRKAIGKAYSKDQATKDEFGIGLTINVSVPDSVNASYERFLTAADAAPEKLAKAFITAEDIAKMRDYAQKVAAARTGQATVVNQSKLSTKARKDLQCSIEEAMVQIVTAATLVFDKQPDVIALFKSTLPKKRSTSRKGKAATNPSSPGGDTDIVPE
jgi:hypothetical protein